MTNQFSPEKKADHHASGCANVSSITVGEASDHFDYDTHLDRSSDVLKHIMEYRSSTDAKPTFLDLGGRDGKLKILLGSERGVYDKARHGRNKKAFHRKFDYVGSDLKPSNDRVLVGDFCREDYLDENAHYIGYFDVIYSNNVFEHLQRPWITVRHIDRMLKAGGLCAIVVPFSQRYHRSPDDYFRYTHRAIASLFQTETPMRFEVLASGYDIHQRRMNVLGRNKNALVEDAFGGWRETWYTVTVLKKKAVV